MNDILVNAQEVVLKLRHIGTGNEKSTSYYYHIYLPDGRKIGRAELHSGHDPSIEFIGNLGYYIHPVYRGHHYAAAASRQLLKIAREELKLDYLNITCDIDNIPSIKTIESLGAQLVGCLSRMVRLNSFANYEHRKFQYRLELAPAEEYTG